MRRIGLLVMGVVLVMVGAFFAISGVALLAVIGPDGVVSSPATRVVAPGSAVTVDAARFDGGLPTALSFSEATVTVVALDGQQVFVGVGPSDDVLAYLAGTSYDVLVGADGRSDVIDQETVTGAGVPSRPAAQSFWTTQDLGTGPTSITVPLGSAEQLVVAMNADASAPIDLRWSVSVSAPWSSPVALAAISGGLVMLILGGWCLTRGTRAHDSGARPNSAASPGSERTATTASDPHAPTTIVVPDRPPGEWGSPIVPSDDAADITQALRSLPTQRVTSNDTRLGPITTPDEVDLRLLGSPVLAVAVGPDAPPREPRG